MARPSINEIGPNLARLREAAGIKQADLAGRVTMSAPSLSRVESGERSLAPEELDLLLREIGTADATRFAEFLARDWSELPVPPLNHAEQDLLWEADQACVALRGLVEGDIKASFQKRIEEYLTQIRATATLILKRDHTVALIGSIGIGKSTAICRALSLELPSEDGPPQTVLEVGAGGITVCEVHIYSGPSYGLLVEPCPEDEVRAHVMDFSEFIWRAANGKLANSEDESESQGVSKEIERAIRNLSGLRVRKNKGSDGKVLRTDDAKALAAEYTAPRDFGVEVLSRMALHRRDARTLWYDTLSGKAPLAWLREMFLEINNGRHPDFSLPRRIELVVPLPLVANTDLNIRFIDTKGIDRAVGRQDLEAHLQDPHSLALLCSRFNNAPGTEARQLLTRAKEAGQRRIDRSAALLVLPHPGEALKMKDDATSELVESVEEGCELKQEQVVTALESTGIHGMHSCFFNALEDPKDKLVRFVMARLVETRQGFSTELAEIVQNVKQVIANQEREQAQAILRDAASQLQHWVAQNKQAPAINRQVQRSLLQEINSVHPSTVHAAVRRQGDWAHLQYGYQLGHGARTLAAQALGKKVNDFVAIAENLRTNPDFTGAESLISQCEQVLNTAYDQILRKMQLSGESLFDDEMKKDKDYWFNCSNEWGQGSGYRDRVTMRSEQWFDDDGHQAIGNEVRSLIATEWVEALGRVERMLQDV
ncbi:helix-turn-helix domain-containing protein [Undibacterium sp. Xuan67W]|uniref:helix-turn-helix domain-containing protein n=1 Tax=Undibacterium sp. Xuan67W TaxID=3413057 RepID=UPI003BF1DAD6